MKKVTRNECGFAELFEYAEEYHGVDWNSCNDLFFHSILTYRSHNKFTLEEVRSSLEDEKQSTPINLDKIKALEILASFLVHNKIENCWVDST